MRVRYFAWEKLKNNIKITNMKKKFTMLLAALFLVMGSAWAQVYQKVPHTQWIVTALNEARVQGDEGGVAFLKDENPSTFYHSDYDNSYEGRTAKKGQDGLQAFMVEMGEVASFDRITYAGRSNGDNNWATKVRIYVFETLPAGWPKDGENNKTLSALTYTEKEELLKRTDNTVLGTPAFDTYVSMDILLTAFGEYSKKTVAEAMLFCIMLLPFFIWLVLM